MPRLSAQHNCFMWAISKVEMMEPKAAGVLPLQMGEVPGQRQPLNLLAVKDHGHLDMQM